jgi:hypothetical protein
MPYAGLPVIDLVGTALGLGERELGVHRMLRWQLPDSAGTEGGSHVRA